MRTSRLPALLTCAYALLLTYILLAPHPLWVFGWPGKATEETIDRNLAGPVQHVLAYAVFYGLGLWWYRSMGRRGLITPGVVVLAHGIVAEFAQNWIPFRQADCVDLAGNVVGIGAGMAAAAALTVVPRFRSND